MVKNKSKITKNMTFHEIFEKFPKHVDALAAALTEAGMHCFGCSAGGFESLEMGCKAHGFSGKYISNLLSKLNKILEKT